MMLSWWNEQLSVRAFLVFQRLRRLSQTFIVLSALISALDVGALTFNEFELGGAKDTPLMRVAEGFLCSSALTAVVAALGAAMLFFQFEGMEQATRLDLLAAWTPLTLMDISIIEFLLGMTCWYFDKNVLWRGALMVSQLATLLAICLAFSVFMWAQMTAQGGLGQEERLATMAERSATLQREDDEMRGPHPWLGTVRDRPKESRQPTRGITGSATH